MKIDEIKCAALKHIAEKGLFNTSLQDIAQDVSLNKATLYFYFNNKTDLYLALLQDCADLYLDIVNKALDENIEKESLEIVLKNIFLALANDLPKDSFLLWNEAVRITSSGVDEDLYKGLRKIIDNFNDSLFGILANLVTRYMPIFSDNLICLLESYKMFINGFLERKAINIEETEDESIKMAGCLWDNFWRGADKVTIL